MLFCCKCYIIRKNIPSIALNPELRFYLAQCVLIMEIPTTAVVWERDKALMLNG